MQRKLNQKGFSLVEGLLVIIVVLLIVFIGYYIWHSNRDANKTVNTNSTTSSSAPKTPVADSYASWKTYTTKAGGLTFRYPADWTLDYGKALSPDAYNDVPDVTAPDGFHLEIGAESTGHPGVDFPIYIQFTKLVSYAGRTGYLDFADLSGTTNNNDAGKPSPNVNVFQLSKDKNNYDNVPSFSDKSGSSFNILAQGIIKQPEAIATAKTDPDILQAAKIVQSITLPR